MPDAGDLDVDRLASWLAGIGLELVPPVEVRLIAGGRSNLTFVVRDGAGQRYVVRRPPYSHTLATAHDVGREHRIISALFGTAIPVPRPRGLCVDPGVIGAPFYVMDFIDGVVLATADDAVGLSADDRMRTSENLVTVLGHLHELEPASVGLHDLGPIENYAERQLRRWHRQVHASAQRELPLMDELHDTLSRTIPHQRYSGIVHGDYRPGNIMFSNDGTVLAVLDWELTALGDQLADVGWLLATWARPDRAPVLPSPTALPGFRTPGELLDLYAERTGRDVAGVDWYEAFALWKLACIAEGVYSRYLGGAMGDDEFDQAEQLRLIGTITDVARSCVSRLE